MPCRRWIWFTWSILSAIPSTRWPALRSYPPAEWSIARQRRRHTQSIRADDAESRVSLYLCDVCFYRHIRTTSAVERTHILRLAAVAFRRKDGVFAFLCWMVRGLSTSVLYHWLTRSNNLLYPEVCLCTICARVTACAIFASVTKLLTMNVLRLTRRTMCSCMPVAIAHIVLRRPILWYFGMTWSSYLKYVHITPCVCTYITGTTGNYWWAHDWSDPASHAGFELS